ncbi:MAG: hypothetical protein AB1779_08760, partial [Candidatus Thermoplasmatota archaeon]
FIKDSFKKEIGALKTLEYGKLNIIIERGVLMFLAVVLRGKEPEGLRSAMRMSLIDIDTIYKHRFKAWDGTLNGLEEIENIIEHRILRKFGKNEKSM